MLKLCNFLQLARINLGGKIRLIIRWDLKLYIKLQRPKPVDNQQYFDNMQSTK